MIQDEDFHNMGGCVRGRALWRGIDEEIESFFFFCVQKMFFRKKKKKKYLHYFSIDKKYNKDNDNMGLYSIMCLVIIVHNVSYLSNP